MVTIITKFARLPGSLCSGTDRLTSPGPSFVRRGERGAQLFSNSTKQESCLEVLAWMPSCERTL